jgi:hypothetical protein
VGAIVSASLASREIELSSWKRTDLAPHFLTFSEAIAESAGDVGGRGEGSRGSADCLLLAPPSDRGESAAKFRIFLTSTSSHDSAWKCGVARVHHPDDLRGPARSGIEYPLLLLVADAVGQEIAGALKCENTCLTSSRDALLPAAHPVSRSLDGSAAIPVREELSEFDRDLFWVPSRTDGSMNASPWFPVSRREDARR